MNELTNFFGQQSINFDNDFDFYSVERIVSRPAHPWAAKYRGSAPSQHHQKSAAFSTHNLSLNRNNFIKVKNAARAL